jgi:predicted negative regulator of RcsB-dependent stress response
MADGRTPRGGGSSGGPRRGGKPGGRPGGSGSSGSGKAGGGRPASGGRSGDGKPRRDGAPAGRGGSGGGGRGRDDRRDDRRGGPASRGGRPPQRGGRPDKRDREDRTSDQKAYDGPPIPEDVTAAELDKHAMRALQGLPEKLADRVARHLVMAGLLVDEDPETAYQHALAARARAQRVALVREAVGEVAYAAGKFSEALGEFRAAKRMNGALYYTPMMADCERALGRPEKAVKMDAPEVRKALDEAGSVELAIVVAGARRDMGQPEAALRVLEVEPLNSRARSPWVARLRYAYADTLLALGRTDEAVEWFHRTVAVDGNKETDAEERLATLSTVTDD